MPENPKPAEFYARLPSTIPECAIALWVYENVYRVMQERADVRIGGRNAKEHACRVTIRGIPTEKRSRIRDVLKFTGMKQLSDPNGDTGEMFV
jgi:hypothetical protein